MSRKYWLKNIWRSAGLQGYERSCLQRTPIHFYFLTTFLRCELIHFYFLTNWVKNIQKTLQIRFLSWVLASYSITAWIYLCSRGIDWPKTQAHHAVALLFSTQFCATGSVKVMWQIGLLVFRGLFTHTAIRWLLNQLCTINTNRHRGMRHEPEPVSPPTAFPFTGDCYLKSQSQFLHLVRQVCTVSYIL